MSELLTAAQMRAIEAAAMASGEVTGLELMERAGRGVVAAIFEMWPDLRASSNRAVVLCGPGNNGGDGFVIARVLKEWGWDVGVFHLGDAAKMPRDARTNLDRWLAMGDVRALSDLTGETFRGAAVVVDALFGTGLSRPIASGVWGALDMAVAAGARLVAVDILSGVCADSGRILSEGGFLETPAALTVTFERAKLGHRLASGAELSGPVRVVPIGLAQQCDELLRGPASSDVVDEARVSPARLMKTGGHKFAHGHALVVSGPPGRGGAARLAARGALRIGAGLVTVGCMAEAMPEHAARLDAVMLREIGTGDVGGLRVVLADDRVNALCIGPGLGIDARGHEVVADALASKRRAVLDADALTLMSRDPALFAALHDECVLTPHGGEFGRLFPDIAARLSEPATRGPAFSKVDATRLAAKRAGCVVLFKGPDTVIAHPDGRCVVNAATDDRAAPWLATAGSGDVLAGFIAGLLARGFGPLDAAETAAWLHVECARSFGPGLTAEDLPEVLPQVLRALGT